MKQANIYSSLMTLTMARKIMELQEMSVPFEVSIVNGIGKDEKLAKLEWDQTALNKAYEELEKENAKEVEKEIYEKILTW